MDFQRKLIKHNDPILGDLSIRCLSYSDRQQIVSDTEDDTQFMLSLLSKSVINEKGKPVGSPGEWDEYAGEQTDNVLKIFIAACDANGFTPKVVEGN